MPPAKKARKTTDKEYREMLLARIEAADTEPLGKLCNAEEPKEPEFDGSAQVHVEMSAKTGAIRGAMVSFFNGRGNNVSCYISRDGDCDEFPSAIGKTVKFGAERAMTLAADEVTLEAVGIETEAADWFTDSEEHRKEAKKIQAKASMKFVSCKMKKTSTSTSSSSSSTSSSSNSNSVSASAVAGEYLLTPFSGVTNDSWAILPEFESRVRLSSAEAEDDVLLGNAILQRAVVALSREEAKLHPNDRYHAERRKWAV